MTATTQPAVAGTPDSFTGGDLTFTYNPYTIVPAFCAAPVTCNTQTGPSAAVVPCQELVNDTTNDVATYSYTEEQYKDGTV